MLCMSISTFDASMWFLMLFNLSPEVTQGEPRTNHHTRDSEREGRTGLDCLSVNPKRAQMGSLLVLDCTLYILEYMWAARGYP